MSARMQYPLSQRRHTNIAVVRYQKNGVRLEVACYKNKVISYRSGTEDRLDEVLQVDRIFSNVARGHVAPKEDIAAVFGNDMSEEDAIKFMLEHGELQVAQQERTAEVDEISKDIAIIISQKCVNTKTQRPFPSVVIEQALKSIGAGVKLDQPVKKQALALIHQLVESQIIPIARANMKLRCITPTEEGVALLDAWCAENGAQVVERKTSMVSASAAENGGADKNQGDGSSGKPQHSLLLLVQPNFFRDLDTLVKNKLPAGSHMHMVDAAAMEVGEGDVSLITRAAQGAPSSTGDRIGAGGHSTGDDERSSATPAHGRAGKGGSLATSTAPGDDDHDGSGGKRGKGKKGKKGKKGGRRQQSSDSEDDTDITGRLKAMEDEGGSSDDEAPTKGRRGKKGQKGGKAPPPLPAVAGSDALTAELMKLGLDPTTDLADDAESEDEGRGKGKKGKGKNKNKGNSQAHTAPASKKGRGKKAAAAEDSDNDAEKEADSDEELEGNRRQRKKNTQHKQETQNTYNPSDEEFDYGDEEDDTMDA